MPIPPSSRMPEPGQRRASRRGILDRLTALSGVPLEIRYAYVLWLAAAALGVVLSAAALIGALAFYGRGALPLDVPSLIASILAAGATTYLALRMEERADWARIVLTILGVLSVLVTLVSITSVGMGIIPTLAEAAATILMWRPVSRRWFTAPSGASDPASEL